MLVLVEADRVEHVELGFRTEVGAIRYATALEVVAGLLRDVARVSGIELARYRILHERVEDQGRVLPEGVHHGRIRVRHQQHVGFLDLLEAADRGSVEAEALFERLLVELVERHREVLHQTGEVREPDVDELGAALLAKLQDVGRTCCHVRASLQGVRDRSLIAAGTLAKGDFSRVSRVLQPR